MSRGHLPRPRPRPPGSESSNIPIEPYPATTRPDPQELELARIHSQRRERDRLLSALRTHTEAATFFGWTCAVLGMLAGIGLCS